MEGNPLDRCFKVRSLQDFAADFEEDLLLCPVRALKAYLERTSIFPQRPRSLFVSPRNPSSSLSKNAKSFFLREVISSSMGSDSSSSGPSGNNPHSIRGMATSVAFLKNFSLASIMEAATWKSPSVFSTFYLRDIQFESKEGFSLGPFIAANSVI